MSNALDGQDGFSDSNGFHQQLDSRTIQRTSTRVQLHFVVASRARVGRCTPRCAERDEDDADDDLAAGRESDPRRVWRSRGHGERGRGGDEEGDEAEESPSHEGAVRARGEVSVELQGVQRLSARSSAHSVQGVRWGLNLRARSSALSVQGVRWGLYLRARSYTLSVQGVSRRTSVIIKHASTTKARWLVHVPRRPPSIFESKMCRSV